MFTALSDERGSRSHTFHDRAPWHLLLLLLLLRKLDPFQVQEKSNIVSVYLQKSCIGERVAGKILYIYIYIQKYRGTSHATQVYDHDEATH